MKTITTRIYTLLIALILIIFTAALTACGKKYTCNTCGKKVAIAYYDPFATDEVMCEECARDYFAPFPYAGYRVH